MWQKYPLVRLAVPFILGMCGAAASMDCIDWRLDMMFVVMACLLMVLVVCHNVYAHAPLFRRIFTASLFLLIFLFGAILYINKYRHVADAVNLKQTTFRGVVEKAPWRTARSVALDMTTDDGAHLRLYLQPSDVHNPQMLRRGDTLLIQPLHINSTCLQTHPLTPPCEGGKGSHHPDGHSAPLPRREGAVGGSADYAAYNRYLFYNGTSATAYVPADHWQSRSPVRRDSTWNERLHAYYVQSALDSTTLAMVEALTIGRREGLSRPLRNRYAAAGVSHVLALSGMHLALIIGLLDLIIFRFFLYEQRRWLMLSVIPVMWIFTFVADMPPSLVRATVMATFFQFGFALGRQKFVLSTLALAAIIMLCWNPLMLQNVGFQLSFLSMIGVALVAVPLLSSGSFVNRNMAKTDGTSHWLLRRVSALIVMTVSCTLATAPLVAYHFGQIPVYGLVTNLIVPPIVTLLMYCSVAWLLLFFWPDAQATLGHVLDTLVSTQNTVVETISSWPAAVMDFRPGALVTLLLYVLLAAIFWKPLHALGKKTPSAWRENAKRLA